MLVFAVAALAGMPLAFALGVAALAGLAVADIDYGMLPTRMMNAVNSFPLMSIPLFMVAGELMIKGGIMERMILFANALVGRVRGGLAQVAMLAGAILSLVSGTAVSDAAALSSTVGPELKKRYGLGFSTAVIAASANLGPIIPPSAAMIVYAYMAGSSVSIGALFVAAAIPSVIITAVFMAQCWWIAKRRNYPLTGEPFTVRRLAQATGASWLTLALPIGVIVGIIGARSPPPRARQSQWSAPCCLDFRHPRIEARRFARDSLSLGRHVGGGGSHDRLCLHRHVPAHRRSAAAGAR